MVWYKYKSLKDTISDKYHISFVLLIIFQELLCFIKYRSWIWYSWDIVIL